ncbi:MAG TPA: hypothetical protein VGE27_08030 [Gemmatimonas sp.]|uniref:hypothetical protein n=1 Tax=Gemmatimonas sp. TaxID=1962908 RepID=UPI002ED91AFE
MRRVVWSNATLIAVAASYGIQIGAGVFALAVVGRVVSAAPPRSLALLEGPYRYDSSAFWQIMPAITGALFIATLIANWRTRRRVLLLSAFILFALGGVVSTTWLGSLYADFSSIGYQDTVDPALQGKAALWYTADWAARCGDALGGFLLLVALTRPPLINTGVSTETTR